MGREGHMDGTHMGQQREEASNSHPIGIHSSPHDSAVQHRQKYAHQPINHSINVNPQINSTFRRCLHCRSLRLAQTLFQS